MLKLVSSRVLFHTVIGTIVLNIVVIALAVSTRILVPASAMGEWTLVAALATLEAVTGVFVIAAVRRIEAQAGPTSVRIEANGKADFYRRLNANR